MSVVDLVWISVICGILGVITVAYFARYVLRQDEGTARVKEITSAIREGAMTFIHKEYRTDDPERNAIVQEHETQTNEPE